MSLQPSARNRPLASPRRASLWLSAFAVATPLAWSSVAFVYFGMRAMGKPLSVERALVAGLPDWYFWAAFTPAIFWLSARFPLERGRWVGAGLAHLLLGTVVALANIGLIVGFNRAMGTPTFAGPLGEVYLQRVLQLYYLAFMIYWVIVAAAHAVQYSRRFRDREVEAVRLRSQLTEAQLAALRMQLQPHFLFNTLHTIASLVRDGRAEAAVGTITRLGELFRQTLGNVQRDEVALRDELSFVEAYLEIEQTRFSDRLQVRIQADPDTLEARVPNMALQPIVENAIRHGIAREPDGGRVEVRARRENGSLRVEVRNDGPPYAGAEPTGRGVGLSNTRARLQRLYGSQGRLELGPGGAGGTVAVLEIPFR